jgi:hypothetical protein
MNTKQQKAKAREEFVSELMNRARYVQGNQYPENSEEYKAYQSGFESALAMVCIDLTGTHKSKGMYNELIDQTHQATIAEVVRIIEERQKGWLGTAEDGSDRHPHYDELQVIIEAITSNKE